VAAGSEEIAEKALDLIEVEYEELPAVFDPVYGASPEAPLLHPDLGSYEVPNFIFPVPGTNKSNHFKIRKGDTEAAWPKCAAIVEHTFRIPHVQHVPIETHIAVAKVDENGEATLWASSQSPFAARNIIAKTLGISESDMRVVAPFVGGGFGCKAGVTMESLVVGIRYAGYIAREEMEAGRQRAMEERQIPADVDYEGIRGLSNEGRGKLKDVRPLTVGQASRIPGLTPADISILLVYLEARARREAAAISPDLASTSF
jgi:CO/xanthine dehydrogenase Mo-binding subunit